MAEERSLGNTFSHGAVLGTQGEDGMPHTRMLGVSFDSDKTPKFHTSPNSRKVRDITFNNMASLTFAFQQKMRSVSLEGFLEPLSDEDLAADWGGFDAEFRKNYLVFGHQSGARINSLQDLHSQKNQLSVSSEEYRPISFIGYSFKGINRITFYAVIDKDFAVCEVFEFDKYNQCWTHELRAP
ncbi:MAG: pyridoxamine 5'-phosphate oxidase family protein [Acidithiobacillus ferrivorans]